MLHIYFGDMPGAVYNTSVYFDNTYHFDWLEDEFSQKIIKDIDKAVVLGTKAVESKALGVIPIKQLSGGTKTLLLMQHDKSKVYNASTCGDNCAKWIVRMAKKNELTINLHHIMDFGDKDIDIHILNNDTVVHTQEEYVIAAGLLL